MGTVTKKPKAPKESLKMKLKAGVKLQDCLEQGQIEKMMGHVIKNVEVDTYLLEHGDMDNGGKFCVIKIVTK